MAINPYKQINVRMNDDLYNNAKKLADDAGWTMAAWIRRAMEEKINRDISSNINTTNYDAVDRPLTRLDVVNIIKSELERYSLENPPAKRETITRRL